MIQFLKSWWQRRLRDKAVRKALSDRELGHKFAAHIFDKHHHDWAAVSSAGIFDGRSSPSSSTTSTKEFKTISASPSQPSH